MDGTVSRTPYASMIWFRFKGCFSARNADAPVSAFNIAAGRNDVKALVIGSCLSQIGWVIPPMHVLVDERAIPFGVLNLYTDPKTTRETVMRHALIAAFSAAFLIGISVAADVSAGPFDKYEVYGVDDDDMLKMRAGPGVGYNVIVGLPNGTVLRVGKCEQTGGTRWCQVSLDRARGLKGYVSWAYLRKQ